MTVNKRKTPTTVVNNVSDFADGSHFYYPEHQAMPWSTWLGAADPKNLTFVDTGKLTAQERIFLPDHRVIFGLTRPQFLRLNMYALISHLLALCYGMGISKIDHNHMCTTQSTPMFPGHVTMLGDH